MLHVIFHSFIQEIKLDLLTLCILVSPRTLGNSEDPDEMRHHVFTFCQDKNPSSEKEIQFHQEI